MIDHFFFFSRCFAAEKFAQTLSNEKNCKETIFHFHLGFTLCHTKAKPIS
jgi:hypothetical protein